MSVTPGGECLAAFGKEYSYKNDKASLVLGKKTEEQDVSIIWTTAREHRADPSYDERWGQHHSIGH